MPDWTEVLNILQNHVTTGKVTTYGELASVVFGGPNAGPAIGAMLKGAINDSPDNRLWTNRVVNAQGELNVDGQREQLESEGVLIQPNGNIDFTQCPPVKLTEEDGGDGGDPPPPPPPTDQTAFEVFSNLIDQQGCVCIDDLKEILQNTPYEKSSFANFIFNELEQRLQLFFDRPHDSLFTLIMAASDQQLLQSNAIDLAHLIRKTRNQIIHHDVPVTTFHARNYIIVSAACVLWPQLPG